MGNYKFKLSDMIPNAWFYKLKDMTRIRTRLNNTKPKYIPCSSFAAPNNLSRIPAQPHLSGQRKSYYFTRDLTNFHPTSPIKTKIPDKAFSINSPRKSSSKKRRSVKRRLPNRHVTSFSAGCNCGTTLKSWTKPSPSGEYLNLDQMSEENGSILPEFNGSGSPGPVNAPDTFDGMVSWSTSCQCRAQNDVVFDKQFSEFNNLPPIITKKQGPDLDPTKLQTRSVKVVKENVSRTKKRFSMNSSSPVGVKLRTSSPKIGNRRIQGGRKSVRSSNSCLGLERESLAVVKLSEDPGRDFRESMVEMIVENNITVAKELEELLVCYLLLNSDDHHGIIINVFKQIWFDSRAIGKNKVNITNGNI